MTYKFTIPGTLPSLNDYIFAFRKSKYQAASMKHQCKQIVTAAAHKLRKVRFENPVHITYRWIEPNRRRDMDNISSFGRKVIQDALVSMGVLANDGWKEIAGFKDEFAVDKHRPRIEVEISENE